MNFAGILRQRRRQAEMTQDKLAVDAEVARSTISLLERGKINPTLALLLRLARALNVTHWDDFLPPIHDDNDTPRH